MASTGAAQASTTRSIFITGAASGIGRETARLFAARGWQVGLFDLDAGGLETLAGELRSAHGEAAVTARPLDVRDAAAVDAAVEQFRAAFDGRLDVLFNCAGVMVMGRFGEVPLASHLRTVEVNVCGVLIATWAALPLLRATPGARVISMGSASGFYGVPELASYSASKFFVRGLTEALNLELEREGIWVTDLMPLYVDTPMVRNQSTRIGSLRTFGTRLGPREIAELVWRAAYRRRVHWVPLWWFRLLTWLGNLVPSLSRPVMRRLGRL
jgi:NAD(P)-dependent dehydrogenase (short-subunit alcohol dehydrogenase family)